MPRFAVVGGAEAGVFYVRQLLRAVEAGRLSTDAIVVVDRDPGCAAARVRDPRVRVEVADWSAWLDGWLDAADPAEHLVPYHWAPHLLLGWIERSVARGGGFAQRAGTLAPRGLPLERDTAAGDRALSYAGWICPVTCIEPDLCPHTRGPRDWSLAGDLEGPAAGERFQGRLVFRCLHLVYGVGTIPVADIRQARERVLDGLREGGGRYLVATSSHCHALATAIEVRRESHE
ncbi:MAG TPA: hypothetical protein VFO85_10060 [Vicinamibacteria bacterium]|nr:hypothetical protein [Vicinamibacteria bacterium]